MRNLTKALLVVIAVILIGAGCSVGNKGGDTSRDDSIKVGAVLPLTGNMSIYGQPQKRGIKMAVEEINEKGGINNKEIEIVFEDSRYKSKQAVSAIKRLVNVEKIDALLMFGSRTTAASVGVIDNNNIPTISYSALSAGDRSEHIFRNYWDIKKQGKVLAKEANERGIKRASLMLIKEPACLDNFQPSFKKHFKGKILETVKHPVSANDVRSQLTKVNSTNSEILVHCSFPVGANTNIKQFHQLGLDKEMDLYGIEYIEPPVTTNGQEYLQKVNPLNSRYFISEDLKKNERMEKFINKYRKKFPDKKLSVDAVYAYDSVKMLAKSLESCAKKGTATNYKCLEEELHSIKNFPGVIGKISFDNNGNSEGPTKVVRYKNDGWKLLEVY